MANTPAIPIDEHTGGEITAACFVLLLCLVLVVAAGFVAGRYGWKSKSWHWTLLNVLTFYSVGIIYGMLGGHNVGDGWSLGDSVYFTTVTVTTVGYGDEFPASQRGKVFVCFFIFIGLAIIGDALAAFVEFLVEKQEAAFKALVDKVKHEEVYEDGTKEERKHAALQQLYEEMAARHKKDFTISILEILGLLLIGTVFYSLNEPNFTWIDGLYWSSCTISTVGYGDLGLEKASSRDFTIFYIFFSVAIVTRNLGKISQIAIDRRAFEKRKELLNKPLDADTILNMDEDGDGGVDSGEFLMAMLVQEGLVSEEACELYLDRFRDFDKTGDGKLDADDLAALASEERAKAMMNGSGGATGEYATPRTTTATPAAMNPLQNQPDLEQQEPATPPLQDEYPVIVPESFSTSVQTGRESYQANAEQERVDDAIIGHAKEGGNLQHVMQSDRLAKIQAVFRAMDDDMSGEITTDEMLDFAKIYKGNPNFSRRRCQNLLNKIDTSRNGMINEAEFVAFFAGLTNSITDEEIFNRGIQKYMDAAQELNRRSRQQFQQG